jgi:hypothetical protein
MDKGQLVYEYNMLIIERTAVRSEGQIASGKHTFVIDTTIAKPGAAADVVLMVDGKTVSRKNSSRDPNSPLEIFASTYRSSSEVWLVIARLHIHHSEQGSIPLT